MDRSGLRGVGESCIEGGCLDCLFLSAKLVEGNLTFIIKDKLN